MNSMKMLKRNLHKYFAVLLTVLLAANGLVLATAATAPATATEATSAQDAPLTQAAPVSPAPAVEYTYDFATACDAVIGVPGQAITVFGDGSYTVSDTAGGDVIVSFGMDSRQNFRFASEPYPVISRKFVSGDVTYTVTQFADTVKTGVEDKTVSAVFTKVSVKNDGKTDVAFPTASAGAVPFLPGDVPATVPAGGEVFADYYSLCFATEFSGMTGSFDSHLAEMTAHWDAVIKSELDFKALPDTVDSIEFCKSIIYDKINGTGGESMCLKAAQMLLSGNTPDDEILAQAQREYNALCPEIASLSDGYALVLKNGAPSLSDNLDALITLKSYIYICKKTANTVGEQTATGLYAKLLPSVERAMSNTISSLVGSWTAVTAKGDADKMIFSLSAENSESAMDLCRWYVCDGILTGASDTSYVLNSQAAAAFAAAEHIVPDSLVPALLSQSQTGALLVGKGIPTAQLRDGTSVSVENFKTADNTVLALNVSVSGNEITVSVSTEKPAAVTVCFPLLRGNIESATCAFDFNTGVVTAPAGTTEIGIKLIDDTSVTIDANRANLMLEKAIFNASLKNTENCTSVSKEIFKKAYDSAVSARGIGNTESIMTAASELAEATNGLSEIVARYTFALSDGKLVGRTFSSAVSQIFNITSDGTLDKVDFAGEYADGLKASVYTLKVDGKTPDKLLGESVGTKCEGGIRFNFEIAVKGGTAYVICISGESGRVCLNVLSAEANAVGLSADGADAAGVAKVCVGAALDAEFSVLQADRAELDVFYQKCVKTDTKEYTKESVKNLNAAMKTAKELLCTPSVTESDAKTVLDSLKTAFSRLETYASDNKKVEFPTALAVLIGASVLLLGAIITTVTVANAKKNKKEKELLEETNQSEKSDK